MDPVVTTVLSCDIASDRVGFEGLSYRGPMDQEAQGLVALFRAAQSTNNVALTRLEEWYSEGTFPAAPLDRPSYRTRVPWTRRLQGRPQVRVSYFLNRPLLRVVV